MERTTPFVRDRRASWSQSLEVLRLAKEAGAAVTKTSIMLGCGETPEEVVHALKVGRPPSHIVGSHHRTRARVIDSDGGRCHRLSCVPRRAGKYIRSQVACLRQLVKSGRSTAY